MICPLRSLQQTNKGLGEEVEDLKKKMGEFETKVYSTKCEELHNGIAI